MAKGISIGVASDTREFASGIRDGVIKPLEDADKAIQELGDGGNIDDLERDMKGAQKATEQYSEEIDKAKTNLRELQRQTRSGGGDARSFGDSATDSLKRTSAAAEETGAELKANISETFSSFRGDASDFAQVAQDTLGGLAAGFEGIPAIAAVAAGAAGIGLILGAIENGQVQSEAWRQDVADLTTQFIEAGKNGGRGLDNLVDKLKELATTGDDAGVTLDKLNDLSKRSGTDYEAVARAYAGNTKALRDLIKSGDERIRQLSDESNRIDTNNDKDRARYGTMIDQIRAQSELNDYLDQAADKADEAAKNADLFARSGAAEMQAKAELIQNIDQAYDDAAGSVGDYVNAETGVFNVDAYIEAMQAKAAALDGYKTNLQKAALTLSPDAISFLQSQGAEGAAQLVQAYVNGTDAQKAQLGAIWTTAGKTSADSYTTALKNNVPATLPGPVITPTVDYATAQAQFDQFFKLNNGKTITNYVETRPGRGVN